MVRITLCVNINESYDDDWVLPLVTSDEINTVFSADFGCNKWLIDFCPKKNVI